MSKGPIKNTAASIHQRLLNGRPLYGVAAFQKNRKRFQ